LLENEKMANQARKKRRRAAAADKRRAGGQLDKSKGGKVKVVNPKPPPRLWDKSKPMPPHCGTYDGRRKQMSMTVEDVGPEKALGWLGTSDGNRNTIQGAVNRYCVDILRERWPLTPQGIAFDTNGALVDGHHRLKAIIKSGKTVKMAVFRDVPVESVPFLDYGVVRLEKDVMARDGIRHAKKIIEVVKAAVLSLHGSKRDVSKDLNLAIGYAYLPYIQWILEEMGIKQRAPVYGTVLRAVANEGMTERICAFCNHMRDNTNEGKNCPVNALQRYLAKVAAKTASGHHNDIYPRVQAALKAFNDGKPLTRLCPVKADHWPFDVDL